jgi:hypothetical protein
VFAWPENAYTRALVEAVPRLDRPAGSGPGDRGSARLQPAPAAGDDGSLIVRSVA